MSTTKARLKQNMRLKIPTLIVNFVISVQKAVGLEKSSPLWILTYPVNVQMTFLSVSLVLEEVGVNASSKAA